MKTAKKINLDTLADLVEGYLEDPHVRREIPTQHNKITRNMKTFELTSKCRVINFAVVFEKRRL